MADFGKVGGGKGGKGSRGSRTRNFKSPIAKISGRKKSGQPDYECKFEWIFFMSRVVVVVESHMEMHC